MQQSLIKMSFGVLSNMDLELNLRTHLPEEFVKCVLHKRVLTGLRLLFRVNWFSVLFSVLGNTWNFLCSNLR